MIKYVAERNKNKYGLYTPGTKIKIIPEFLSIFMSQIIIWFYRGILKRNFIERERNI